MTNKEKIERQCVALCELLKRKNHDYGDSFAEPPYLAPNLNVATAAFVRLSDKFKRLQTLVARNAECRDETLQDTLRDVAGYCVLLLAHFDGGVPTVEKKGADEE